MKPSNLGSRPRREHRRFTFNGEPHWIVPSAETVERNGGGSGGGDSNINNSVAGREDRQTALVPSSFSVASANDVAASPDGNATSQYRAVKCRNPVSNGCRGVGIGASSGGSGSLLLDVSAAAMMMMGVPDDACCDNSGEVAAAEEVEGGEEQQRCNALHLIAERVKFEAVQRLRERRWWGRHHHQHPTNSHNDNQQHEHHHRRQQQQQQQCETEGADEASTDPLMTRLFVGGGSSSSGSAAITPAAATAAAHHDDNTDDDCDFLFLSKAQGFTASGALWLLPGEPLPPLQLPLLR